MLENYDGTRHTYIQKVPWEKLDEPTKAAQLQSSRTPGYLEYIAVDVDDYGLLFITKQDLLNMLESFDTEY